MVKNTNLYPAGVARLQRGEVVVFRAGFTPVLHTFGKFYRSFTEVLQKFSCSLRRRSQVLHGTVTWLTFMVADLTWLLIDKTHLHLSLQYSPKLHRGVFWRDGGVFRVFQFF